MRSIYAYNIPQLHHAPGLSSYCAAHVIVKCREHCACTAYALCLCGFLQSCCQCHFFISKGFKFKAPGCSRSRTDGITLSHVNQSNTSQSRLFVSSCMWKMSFIIFLQVPCEVAYRILEHKHISVTIWFNIQLTVVL